MAAQAATIELAQTGKRDALIALEKKAQARWAEEHLFDTNAPSPEETKGLSREEIQAKFPKWFGNFPFPYMNGALHLGHAFTITKIEFAAGYQRMLGKRVLYPHAFHVTGLPIKVAADKLVREIETFGPDFEKYEAAEAAEAALAASTVIPTVAADAPEVSTRVDKAKKGKAAAKNAGLKHQFMIMESIGVPRSEIKKFADTSHWLEYFPPLCIEDHGTFGSRIDWRRTFMTTDANPYYDAFVRWEINKLRAMGKIKFGERYTIYSARDGQPCMDHDRSAGEALGPQEYTAVKMELVSWSPAAAAAIGDKLSGRKVYLVAATLRPETMYGQTNCFVGTIIKYGVFAGKNGEAYVCTRRAARNMAFQGALETDGQVSELAEVEGSALVGSKIKAPLGIIPEVYVLPMDNVLATKGTGVVTSVPSDSPDDFATLADLKKKPEFYKIETSWVAVDPVPVLSTPTYGEMTAPALVKEFKIQSQKDVKQLAEAKEIAYKEGFYSGTMLVGDYKGQSVQDAKPKVRANMIEKGLAFAYAEPEGMIISRSGDECIVALMDQWYLDYGEPTWRAQAEKLVAKMGTYGTATRNGFEGALAWLNQWACARTYGLGTKLPWDPHFMVESLSDSTIYMAYYTIAHYLQGGVINGSKPGPLGITPDQLSDEFFDYIFCGGTWPSECTIAKEKADLMKHDFEYFYPFDVRSSGKDLIPNHLSFCVYTHAALFDEKFWPLNMRTNGHLMLNGEKMSKSTGNFLTMSQAVKKFGTDATRLSLADAGDGIEDSNFDEKTANANILRLHTLIAWCEENVADESKLRTGSRNSYHDKVFEEEVKDLINITKERYESTDYKDALKYGFYELQSVRDWYREVTAETGMHADLVKYWIRIAALLVQPVAPHFSEHIWSTVLKEPKSVQLARWPEPDSPVDRSVVEAGAYMRSTIKMIRDAELALLKRAGKGKGGPAPFDPKKPRSVRVYVSSSFPEWQDACVAIVKESYAEEADKVDDAKVRQLLTEKGLIKDKRAMPFVQAFKKRMGLIGAKAAFQRTLSFDEAQVLTEILPYLKKTLNLVDAEIYSVEDALSKEGPGFTKTIIESSEPGGPAFEYRNV